MTNRIYFILLAPILFAVSCIGDDFIDDRVDPVLRIDNPIDSLAIDSSYQFTARFLNNVGREETITPEWSSSHSDIISISPTGLATANAPGSAEIMLEYTDDEGLHMDAKEVGVGERTQITESNRKKGVVNTTTFYKLTGEFVMYLNDDGDLILEFFEDYEASTALPGLYVYLTNNPNTTSGALEIQAVEVFEGAHSYILEGVGLDDYSHVLYFCKPFNVKVGDGEIEDE